MGIPIQIFKFSADIISERLVFTFISYNLISKRYTIFDLHENRLLLRLLYQTIFNSFRIQIIIHADPHFQFQIAIG